MAILVVNTEKILAAKTMRLFPGRARLVIHGPVGVLKYGRDKLDRLIEDVKDTIQRGLDEYAVE